MGLRILTALRYTVNPGSSTPVLEGWCLAEFNSNLNQTHPHKLIKMFRVARKSQKSWQVKLGLEPQSAEHGQLGLELRSAALGDGFL